MEYDNSMTLVAQLNKIKYADSMLIIGLSYERHELTISQIKRSDGSIFRCPYSGTETRLLFLDPDMLINIFKGAEDEYGLDPLRSVEINNGIVEFNLGPSTSPNKCEVIHDNRKLIGQ